MNLREIYARERLRQGQAGQAWEEPAPYFLDEVLALRDLSWEDLREIHKSKLAYPGIRVVQDRREEEKNHANSP